MKHVFRISSHLTFYLSKKIIEVKGIDYKDCIMFLVRDYSIPTEYADRFPNTIQTSYNVSQTKGRVFAGLNILKTRKNIKEFDQLIDGPLGGEDFIWYAQICNDDFCSLMVSKKNCKGYYVIEDGLGSYLPKNPQTFVGLNYWVYKLVLRPLFPRIFLVKNHFISTDSDKFKGCIATSQDCFPLHQQYLEVVGNPFETSVETSTPIDAILSIDPLYLFMENEVANKVYADLAAYIKSKGYKHIYCKYHPYFNSKSNADIRKTFEEYVSKYFGDIKELGSEVVLENLFSTYKCDFYTNHSSVALYAHNMGATCYTYNPIIKKHKPDYKEVNIVNKFCVQIPV